MPLKISVVLVNKNLAIYLEEAILSIIRQNYTNLELLVVDGGSTDGSVEIIKKYQKEITWWISEEDEGQYDAVQKGFDRCTGDVMTWINSDDMYMPGAFVMVSNIFNEFTQVTWLTGIAGEYSPEGTMIRRITLPWSRWSKHRYYMYDFQFIQQESTFWRKELWQQAGSRMSTEYSLAGDLELWTRFFRHAKLYTTTAELAGFRYRKNQRSTKQREDYLDECLNILQTERHRLGLLLRSLYSVGRPIALVLGSFFYNNWPILSKIYPWMMRFPKVIGYDFSTFELTFSDYQVRFPSQVLFGKQRSIHKRQSTN